MNIKKLDEKDIAFIDQPWSEEDTKQFSAFLQKRKLKKQAKQNISKQKRKALNSSKPV